MVDCSGSMGGDPHNWARAVGIGEHHVEDDGRGLLRGDIASHLAEHLARPRPASQIGDALVIYCDHGDFIAGRPRRSAHAEVVFNAAKKRALYRLHAEAAASKIGRAHV